MFQHSYLGTFTTIQLAERVTELSKGGANEHVSAISSQLARRNTSNSGPCPNCAEFEEVRTTTCDALVKLTNVDTLHVPYRHWCAAARTNEHAQHVQTRGAIAAAGHFHLLTPSPLAPLPAPPVAKKINRELRAELERSQGQGTSWDGQQQGEAPQVGELEDRLMNYQSQIKVQYGCRLTRRRRPTSHQGNMPSPAAL